MLTLRLLACALVSAGAFAATTTATAAAPERTACEHPDATVEQQTMRADAVFTGTVASREQSRSKVTYAVDVDLVNKGDLGEEATVVTPRLDRACGLPDLQKGSEYLWFATTDGDRLATTADSGTAPATASRVQQVEDLLGTGTSPTPPEPVEETFTPVAGERASVTRLAAPGVALVLVGLLGLVLVAALGRRRP